MKLTESLKQQAVDRAGLSDFGGTHYESILGAYAQDLDNPQLNETGRHVFSKLMVNDLARRLQVIGCLNNNPEINDVPIPPILYISGLERTGTTFLHNLLGLDQKSKSLKRWELMHPTPPPEHATYHTDARIKKTKTSIDKLRGSLLEQMHWVEAEDPEECAWAVIDGFGIMGASAALALPTYWQEILAHDPEPRFREYRQIVKMLLWKNPPPRDGHLVLKCPQFLAFLPTFQKVFPEARPILTHRDPFRAATSICTMQAHIQRPFFRDKAVLDRSTYLLDLLVPHVERRLSLLSEVYADDPNVTHVAYPHLVQNPIETVKSIYRTLDMSPPQIWIDVLTNLSINKRPANALFRQRTCLPLVSISMNS